MTFPALNVRSVTVSSDMIPSVPVSRLYCVRTERLLREAWKTVVVCLQYYGSSGNYKYEGWVADEHIPPRTAGWLDRP